MSIDRKEISAVVNSILRPLAATPRDLVSDGFKAALDLIKEHVGLKIHRYRTGQECWTWVIPPKWEIKDAYIKHNDTVLISYAKHPLHVMSYSEPVKKTISGRELLEHIVVHKVLPQAIPYEFSFYERKWAFCMTRDQKENIKADDFYDICIDSRFVDGHLAVGEYTIKGTSDEYIFFLSHLDHPCQVNDGLIGAAVITALAKALKKESFYYNYTFLFVPEMVGSVAFLSQNEKLIPKIRTAVFVEMVGLSNPMVLQGSYKERGLINKYALHAMRKYQGVAQSYPFLTVAANDEKVFDAPGVEIPSISITRVDQDSRLQAARSNNSIMPPPYPEYHSSLDDLNLVNEELVWNTVQTLYSIVQTLEADFIPVRKFAGPVFLSRYDLWVDWRKDPQIAEKLFWLMYELEGKGTVFQIAEKLGLDLERLVELLNKFYEYGLISKQRISHEFDRAG